MFFGASTTYAMEQRVFREQLKEETLGEAGCQEIMHSKA